jgi:hypothetical protein
MSYIHAGLYIYKHIYRLSLLSYLLGLHDAVRHFLQSIVLLPNSRCDVYERAATSCD